MSRGALTLAVSRAAVPGLLLALGITACKFSVPVAENTGREIEARLLGRWTQVAGPGLKPEARRHGLLLEFAGNDYLLVYRLDGRELYFRGYPLQLAGRQYLQVQFIGTSNGSVPQQERSFDLLRYDLDAAGRLRVAALNQEIIDPGITDARELRQAIEQRLGSEGLFRPLGEFRRQPRREPAVSAD